MDIQPTTSFHEHLLIAGNTIKVFKIDIPALFGLGAYNKNKVAKELGLSSLGAEIYASLYALYTKDRLFKKGGELGLGSNWDEASGHEYFSSFFRVHSAAPRVLASRAYALDEVIRKRRRRWVALIRDTRKNAREQPFFFWGAVLAILFGICTLVQTVASVWALVLAIQAA